MPTFSSENAQTPARYAMTKSLTALAAATTIGIASVAAPSTADARWEEGGGRLSAALPLARSSGARSHGPITDMATAMGPITATGTRPITAMAIRRITATATTRRDLITAITTHGGITTAGSLGAATVCVPIRVADGQPQGTAPSPHHEQSGAAAASTSRWIPLREASAKDFNG